MAPQPGRIYRETVAAEALSCIHRDVGLLQELIRLSRTLRGDSRPEAAGYGQVVRAVLLGGADSAHDPVADHVEIIVGAQPAAQQYEFVSAESSDRIAAARDAGQVAANIAQHSIAYVMPECVVDALEVV